jgi:16S rRNA (uracil1498-N3)-methyltransferase
MLAKAQRHAKMSRRRFYAQPALLAGQTSITLGDDEARHARDVLRLQPGDDAYVFDGEGHEYRFTIAEVSRRAVSLDLAEQVEPAKPESPVELTLAMALLKGEKFDLVVQKATELGVTRLVPLITARADVRIRNATEVKRKVERWQRIALEATKQCGRARVMKIEEPVPFHSLVDQQPRENESRLMFAERVGEPLAQVPGNSRSVTALIGSEGGWTDEEIAQARTNGWKVITLGGRTLRAETAGIVVAALLQNRFGDLV